MRGRDPPWPPPADPVRPDRTSLRWTDHARHHSRLRDPPRARRSHTGTLTRASDHETCGAIAVGETDTGREVRLTERFGFDGAPDPCIGFGRDGRFVEGTDFQPLRANEDALTSTGPAGIDPSGSETLFNRCERVSVPLGHAPLT